MVFSSRRACVLLAASTLLLAGAAGRRMEAQDAIPVSAPDPATLALTALAARAGVIFAGQVQNVTRHDASGFVDVRFHIDLPVRGCPPGGVYVLREWAGLWAQAQAARYVAGERYLLLLTARGPSGLSAPVDNTDGAIRLLAADDASTASPADVSSLAVDLRWLRAKAQRATAKVWAGSSGDDLNQALGAPSAANTAPPAHHAAEREAGAITPLPHVSREPLLAGLLPLLTRTRPEAHAAN